MAFTLAPPAVLAGYRLEALDSVASTNAVALERGAAGDAGPLWIVSDHQLAGRGRRGRAWTAPRGNLAASLLLRPPVELRQAAVLGFVASLAVGDALAAVMPRRRVAVGADGGSVLGGGRFELKWPNDVLFSGAKLVGILLETTVLAPDTYALAVGIGINVVGHPEGTPYPATDLRALGASCDAADVFLALSDAWMENVALWRAGRGTAAIREKWLTRAAGLGAPVAVQAEGRVVRGLFETIDEECRFVIRENDGSIVKIAAGEVHFGAVASAHENLKAGA